MELSTEVKKSAFRVGYRLGIGVGKYIDWVRARHASRPEAIRGGAWNEAFDKIADAACAYGNARLDKAVAELDAQTELAIEAYLRPSGNCTFTEYPKEGERPAAVLGDALAAIDAGVDELV